MKKGFYGKILWIDLTNKTFEEEELPESVYKQYLGGYGLAAKLIYERTKANYDPLSPEAIFGFFPGLLTGTAAPFSGRYMVAGKSPLTETWGDANSGGTFGPAIKKCGYDAILIKGAAEKPTYVTIIEGKTEFHDAAEIWGLDIIEAEEKLKEKHGKFIKTAGIGQAGENVSLISGIANDKGRIAARSGFGAVMGSKKLKMLVLRGKTRPPIHDKDKFMDLVKDYNESGRAEEPGRVTKFIINKVPKLAKLMRWIGMGMAGPASLMRNVYHNLGTSVANTLSAETGDSPVKNWKGIGMYDFPYEKSKKISSNNLNEYKVRDYGCYSCPVQCGGILKVPEIDLEETHLPEYETCSSFGTDLLNDDLMSLFKINEMCNRAAIDTISTGATIAFAMECYEEGILTKEDTDGIDLTWGNAEAVLEITKKIINREGIGDLLADGSEVAAQKIGKGSEQFAMTAHGQEIAMHNPRTFPSLATTYAYDPTPGRHTAASVDFIDMGPIDKFQEGFELPNKWQKDDAKKVVAQKMTVGFHQSLCSAGLCMFSTLFGPYPFSDLINAYTGWDLDVDDLLKIGYRIQTLRQAFTLREGVEIADNELPGRTTGHPPDEKGPHKGTTVDYKEFYSKYCEEMGWNRENAHPKKDTLKDLNLEFVLDTL